MTVNLRSIQTQVLINDGTDDLDVSSAFIALSLSSGAWDETGWFRLRGTIQLAAYVTGFAESFDCRNNEGRWAPGNIVAVSLWFGSWVALPTRLRILRYPNRPYPGNRIITLEVGSDGDLLNYRAAEGDPSGITYGTPTAATTLVNAALTRAGAPALTDTISYSLPFSPEKQDGKSWITYAGEVAYVGRQVLWQQADGDIRAAALAVDGLTPFAHYVVGEDEADYIPDSAQESPPQTVQANGTTYAISNVGNTEEVTTETIDGVTVRTTVIYRDRDTTTPEYSERVEQPANIVLPTITTSTTLITESLLERDWTYSSLKSRLEQEVETIRKPVAAVFPGQSFANPTQLVIETRATIDYLYAPLDIIRERKTTLEVATISGITVTTAIAQITIERWQKIGPEEYNYTRTQVNRDGTANPLPQRRSGFANTQPPSTQYRPAAKQRTENSYRGEATFESLAGSEFGEKLWAIQLPSGLVTGNSQCRAIAELWGRIRHGRQFAINWAADITAAWLQSFTPVRRVDFSVPTPGVGWVRSAYLVEALTIDIDARSAAIGGRGIEIGQISTIPFDSETPPIVQPPGAEPEEGLDPPVAPVELQNNTFVGLALGGVGIGAELEPGPIPLTVGLSLGGVGIGADVDVVQPESDATVGLALGGVGIGADVESVQPPSATVGLSLGGVGIGAEAASTIDGTVGLALGGVGIGADVQNGADLTVNLVAWYKMDEASGNAIDAHTSGFDLTQNGSIGSTTGLIGNARSFTAASQFFSDTNSAFDLSATDYHIAMWVNVTNLADIRSFFNGLWGASNPDRAWRCFVRTTGIVSFQVVNTGNTLTNVESSTGITATTTALIECQHIVADKKIRVAINGGAFAEATYTGTVRSSSLFRLGSVDGVLQSMVGWIDEVALWDAALTTEQRTAVYNGGSGTTI